mgnify:CR=1 FL=1
MRWLESCFFSLTGVQHGVAPPGNVCTEVYSFEPERSGRVVTHSNAPLVVNRWSLRRVARAVITLAGVVVAGVTGFGYLGGVGVGDETYEAVARHAGVDDVIILEVAGGERVLER